MTTSHTTPPPFGSSSAFTGNLLTRRAFIRRTGGATVAAVAFSAWQVQAESTTGGSGSGAQGKIIKNLSAAFSSASTTGATCGRIFSGVLTVTFVDDSQQPVQIVSGGHRAGDSDVAQGKDTCTPAGSTTCGTEQTGDQDGFRIPNIGKRTALMIHSENSTPGTQGCIAATDKWTDFVGWMKSTKDSGKNNVPLTVAYSTNPLPDGNNP